MRKRLNIKLVSLLLCAILCTGLLSGCTELASQFYPGRPGEYARQARRALHLGGCDLQLLLPGGRAFGSPDWVELYNGATRPSTWPVTV